MSIKPLTRSFVTVVALALPNISLADSNDLVVADSKTRNAVNSVLNEIICGRDEIEEHEIHYTPSQQLIEDSALMIGCLLREADEGVNNAQNIRIAVRGLQENLATYAANHDMELVDIPDGIIGPDTTQDFIDVAMAMGIDSIFRANAFDPISDEHADMMRFTQELQRFNLSAFEAAQLWAMELEFQEEEEQPTFRDLPLCDDTPGWGVNNIPCDKEASLGKPITAQVTQATFTL